VVLMRRNDRLNTTTQEIHRAPLEHVYLWILPIRFVDLGIVWGNFLGRGSKPVISSHNRLTDRTQIFKVGLHLATCVC
jgi:hypothetical protein